MRPLNRLAINAQNRWLFAALDECKVAAGLGRISWMLSILKIMKASYVCLEIYDLDQQFARWELTDHYDKVNGLAVDYMNNRVFTASQDGAMRVWIFDSFPQSTLLRQIETPIQAIAYCSHNQILLYRIHDHHLVFFDSIQAEIVTEITLTGKLGKMYTTECLNKFAILQNDSSILLLEITQKNQVIQTSIKTSHSVISALTFGLNGKLMVSTGLDQTVQLWDVPAGEMLHSFFSPFKVYDMELHNNFLYLVGENSKVHRVEIEKLPIYNLANIISRPCVDVIYIPSTELIGVLDNSNTLYIIDVSQRKIINKINHPGNNEVINYGKLFAESPQKIISFYAYKNNVVFRRQYENFEIKTDTLTGMIMLSNLFQFYINKEKKSFYSVKFIQFAPNKKWIAIRYSNSLVIHDIEKNKLIMEVIFYSHFDIFKSATYALGTIVLLILQCITGLFEVIMYYKINEIHVNTFGWYYSGFVIIDHLYYLPTILLSNKIEDLREHLKNLIFQDWTNPEENFDSPYELFLKELTWQLEKISICPGLFLPFTSMQIFAKYAELELSRGTTNAHGLLRFGLSYSGSIDVAAFFTQQPKIAIGYSNDYSIRIIDILSNTYLYKLQGHHDRISALAISPSDQLLASGGKDKLLYIWNIENLNISNLHILTLTRHKAVISCLCFIDQYLLVSGSKDGYLALWDLTDGSLLDSISLPYVPQKIITTEKKIAVLTENGLVKMLALEKMDSGQWHFLLDWVSYPIFSAKDTILDNVVGLSEDIRLLFEQRGALKATHQNDSATLTIEPTHNDLKVEAKTELIINGLIHIVWSFGVAGLVHGIIARIGFPQAHAEEIMESYVNLKNDPAYLVARSTHSGRQTDLLYWFLERVYLLDPFSKQPIFTMSAFVDDKKKGYVNLFGIPEFCRSRSGKRHNIVELGGIFSGQDDKIDPLSTEKICEVLPPKDWLFMDRIGKTVTHGIIAGTSRVIEKQLKNTQQFSSIAKITSQCMYYVSLFGMNFYHHYNEILEVKEPEAAASEAAINAAVDTGTVLAIELATTTTKIASTFLSSYEWTKTARFFKGVSSVMDAARFAAPMLSSLSQPTWKATGEAMIESVSFMAIGSATQLVTEEIETKIVHTIKNKF